MTATDPRSAPGAPSPPEGGPPPNPFDPAAVEQMANTLFRASFPTGGGGSAGPHLPSSQEEEAYFARMRAMGQPHASYADPAAAATHRDTGTLRQAGEAPAGGDPRAAPGALPPGTLPPFPSQRDMGLERMANDVYQGAFPSRAGSAPVPAPPSIPTEESSFGRARPMGVPHGQMGDPGQGACRFDPVGLRYFGAPPPAIQPPPTGGGAAGSAPQAVPLVGAMPSATTAAPPKTDDPPFYFLADPRTAAATPAPTQPSADTNLARRDFPALHQSIHGKPLIWLDNAATTQKPRSMIDAITRYYERDNSNVHRGAHTLAARATQAYENARSTVQRFLGAASEKEIVFTRGTTEAVNLVAQTYGRKMLTAGDEVLITILEHHSNIVPWQHVCREKDAVLKAAPVDDRGDVLLDDFHRMISPRTKIVAITQVSNALGTVVPVREMAQIAHRYGARVLIDAAQSVAHMPVDVQALDADFLVFSGHKIFGPTGIGVLYAKQAILEDMPPWQGGGNMIDSVSIERTTYRGPPDKFEAGTGHIAGAVGLAAALDYVSRLGMDFIERYERMLMEYLLQGLDTVPGLRRIGRPVHQAGSVSFLMDGIRTEDVGRYLDREGIAVRAGHHCAQPALRRFGLAATVRPSLALYNTRDDVDHLVHALKRLRRL